jgi:two-component system chemotaxis response regulator CheB
VPPPRTTPYRVLLVDEALTLGARSHQTFRSSGLERVGRGSTPARMLEAVLDARPDVIVLDLAGGEEALRAIEAVMAERPTPILVLQSGSKDLAFRALALGALDMVTLPARPDEAFWTEVSRKLVLLAQVRVVQHVQGKRRRRTSAEPSRDEPPFPLVAIAASLGGPRALAQLLAALPRNLVAPVCICQHISDGFTHGLASWLALETGQHVEEAQDGAALEPGKVYVAPSRLHFRVDAPGRAVLDAAPPIQGFRPSCDALLESVARSFGRRAIGVILTGMGKDGAAGLKAIRDRGGRTIAQDEQSCVVWGMPREAVQLGAAQEVLPLEDIPRSLARLVDEC